MKNKHLKNLTLGHSPMRQRVPSPINQRRTDRSRSPMAAPKSPVFAGKNNVADRTSF